MNMAHAQDYEYDDFEDEEFDEFDEFDDTYDDTPYDDDEADYAVDEADYAVDDTAATPALFRGDVQSSLANLVRISPNINPDQAFVLRAVAAAIATVVQQCQQQQQQQQLTQQQQLLLQQHNQRTSAGQLQAQAVQSVRHHHTNGNHNGHHHQTMTTTTTTVQQTPTQHTSHSKQRKQSHPSSNQSAKKQQALASNQQQQHNSHHQQQQQQRESKHSEQDLAYASSSGVDVETLKTIREFAEELKTRRKFIRLSQKGAAQSLRHFTSGEQPCTDAIIYHFENLQMEPERAIQLIPLLRDWLNWAELQRKSGKQLVLMPAVTKVPRERKRKVVLFNEVAKQHLEASFAKNNHPDKWELDILAEELSIPTRSIRKWFTNRRQRKRFAEKFSP